MGGRVARQSAWQEKSEDDLRRSPSGPWLELARASRNGDVRALDSVEMGILGAAIGGSGCLALLLALLRDTKELGLGVGRLFAGLALKAAAAGVLGSGNLLAASISRVHPFLQMMTSGAEVLFAHQRARMST
jgi:hypothetical protein